jgi:acyl carrier protein
MNKEQIIEWMRQYVAKVINVPVSGIDIKTPFGKYGLDSMSAVGMLVDLSDKIGIDLEEDLIFAYPTIEEFAGKVETLLLEKKEIA